MLRIERVPVASSAPQECALCGATFTNEREAFCAYSEQGKVGLVCAECAAADPSRLLDRVLHEAARQCGEAARLALQFNKTEQRAANLMSIASSLDAS